MTVRRLLRDLWWPSAVNRAKRQFARLREPRYVVGTLVGLAYWAWYAAARWTSWGGGRTARLPEAARPVAEMFLTVAGLAMVGLYWLFGAERRALAFSQAEIQFLFPAPLTRRQLVHYKLFRSLLTALLGAAVTTLLFGRRLGHPLWFTLGSWLALTTLSLHALGASFARARLVELGLTRGLRGLIGLSPVALYAGALGLALAKLEPPAAPPDLAYLSSLAATIQGGWLGALLFPIRAMARIALAADAGDFARVLPAGLAVALVHYLWVLRSAVRFEEASVEWAEERAQWLERRRAGLRAPAPEGSRLAPFRLAARGPPEVAMAWKGLIAAGWRRWARWLGVGTLGALLAVGLLRQDRFPGLTPATGVATLATVETLALVLVGLAALVGPLVARFDLREDLVNLDILRTLPVTGRQLVLGELAGPATVLAVVQWAALSVALAASGRLDGLPTSIRLAIALAAALVAPGVSGLGLLVQNALVVLFPAWVPSGRGRGAGPEAAGLRLLALMGNLVVVAVALVPAALAGVLPAAMAFAVAGPAVIPAGAALGAAVLFAELWLGAAALGRAFERTWDREPLPLDDG